MMEWALIGLTVGVLSGLTGAGGAIVAVPLFVHLLGFSMSEATVLSLVAICVSALLNFYLQRKNAQPKIGLTLAAFAVPTTYLFKLVKDRTPETILSALFAVVCVLSLISVWRGRPKSRLEQTKHPWLALALFGVLIGAIVTMTGLGGGLVIMPLLLGPLGIPMIQAVPTSMLTILLASTTSLAVQFRGLQSPVAAHNVLALVVGSLASAFLIKKFLGRHKFKNFEVFQKALLTLVVIASAISVF